MISSNLMPRPCAVASASPLLMFFVAASVNLHGARPWHQSQKHDKVTLVTTDKRGVETSRTTISTYYVSDPRLSAFICGPEFLAH